MTITVQKLEGCAPAPLAHYLKALAVLRLVAEQADPGARGWWRDDAFWLATTLDREALERFFLTEYQPTPILAPWNGGSGFFYEEDKGLTPLERSTAPRFGRLREGIASARAISAPLAAAIARSKAAEEALKARKSDEALKEAAAAAKAERDREKEALVGACRARWSAGLLEWFDAALALDGDGQPSYPALLGSGGNDGRLDFTNNALQHLAALFECSAPDGAPIDGAHRLLAGALFGSPARGLRRFASGQFLPGSAGGDNMGSGFDGESLVNPWDFVLMLEGCVVLASSVVRRSDGANLPQAAAPFAVRASSAGYGSAARADEGPRGEQWMPLWGQPATSAEVRALFTEGRARVGRETSVRAVDVARAVARLGVARGVNQFQRYGYIERNGQANLAVPLGRWTVSPQPLEQLLDDVEGWIGRLRSLARDSLAPHGIASASRLLDEAVFAACRSGGAARWQRLLIALGAAEDALLSAPRTAGDPIRGLGPVPPLRAAWIEAADDGSPELRLAAALASQDASVRGRNGEVAANIRLHWLPLDISSAAARPLAPRGFARFAMDSNGLANDPEVVCRTHDLERDAIALMTRRVQTAPTLKQRHLGLWAPRGVEAPLADVMAFLRREIDDGRVLALARGLMAVRWWETERAPSGRPLRVPPDPAYALARLAHVPAIERSGKQLAIHLDAEPVARLAAGDLAAATSCCLRRLRASGLRPMLRVLAAEARGARRLAASLAFPISPSDLGWCADLVTKPHADDGATS